MSATKGRDPWHELQAAGQVADPSEAEFVALWEARGRRLEQAEAPSTARPRRTAFLVAAAAVVVIAAGAVAIPVLNGDDRGERRPPAAASSHDGTGTTQSSPAGITPAMTIHQSAGETSSQVAYFGAPAFAQFTRTAFVDDVLVGTITQAGRSTLQAATTALSIPASLFE